MSIEIAVVASDDADFVQQTLTILDGAARDLGRPFDPEVLHLRASDANGTLVGGLVGAAVQGWMFIKYLAVAPEARNLGIGARLLAAAEDTAREKSLSGVYLDTFEFQAPRFYLQQGYLEIGRLPAIGMAPQRIWFAKAFEKTGS